MSPHNSEEANNSLLFITDTSSGLVAVEIAKPELDTFFNRFHEAYHPGSSIAQEVSLWMDKAPQYPMTGGFAHRIFHGHSISDIAAIYDKLGIQGVSEWCKHSVADFCSPDGMPMPFAHPLMQAFDLNVHEAVNHLCFNATDVLSDAYLGTSLLPLTPELRCANSSAKLCAGVALHSKAAVFTAGLSLLISFGAILNAMSHSVAKDLVIREIRNVPSLNAVIRSNVSSNNLVLTSNI